jgi:flagellar motor switch protein FliN
MTNETSSTPNPEGAAAAGQYSPDELAGGGKAAAAKAGKATSDVNLDLVLDVPVNVSLRVGATDMSIRDLVKLVEGSVVALDRLADEPMDVLVNGTLIAHGEIVVVDDRFGVRLTDVVSPVERIQKIN